MRASKLTTIASLAVFALGLAGAATTPKAEPARQPRQCFWARDVHNFAYVAPGTVNLRVGIRDVYQLTLFGPCSEMDFANSVGFDTRGSSSVCDGLGIELIVPSTLGPERCPVRSLRRLSQDEVAALPRGARP